MSKYTITADGHRAYPGDTVWVQSSGGWIQKTVGECFEHKIVYTCVCPQGDVGAKATNIYVMKPE